MILLCLLLWTTFWGAILCRQTRAPYRLAPIAIWVVVGGLFYYQGRYLWLRLTDRSEQADKEEVDDLVRGLGGKESRE